MQFGENDKIGKKGVKEVPKILHPEEHAISIYADNSQDIIEACEELNWNHHRSTLRRSETNGTAERRVRRVKEGTSSVLVQSGLGKDGVQKQWRV